MVDPTRPGWLRLPVLFSGAAAAVEAARPAHVAPSRTDGALVNPDHLEAFRTWLLEREQLSPTSVRKVVSDLRTMAARGPTPPEATLMRRRVRDYRWAWALWADWCDLEEIDNPLPQPPELPAEPTHRARRRRRDPKRLKEAVSIPREQWLALLEVVAADPSPPARVIDVMCASALRISDVLRTRRDVLDEGFSREDGITAIEIKGRKPIVYSVRGAEEEWLRLHQLLKPRQMVCDLVSPKADGDWTASGPAYQRCRRKLFELAAKVDLDGRVHLHRLRRTMLVLTSQITGNKAIVQKVAGHEDAETTEGYLDEAMALEVAMTLADVRRKIRGTQP